MHQALTVSAHLLMRKESLERQVDSGEGSPTSLVFQASGRYLSEPSITVTEKVSLLHRHPRRDSLLTVFYFESDYHCTFDLSQLANGISVRRFIAIAIEQYCLERWRFTPECLQTASYEVKLADFLNQHDPLIDPIDQDQLLATFAGTCLCLLRTQPRQSNLRLYQEKLEQMCDVFEVDVHIQALNERKLLMNHIVQMPKGSSIGELKTKLINGCGIIDLAEECVLLEYSRLIMYPLALSTTKIPERHFQLMRIRHHFFADEPRKSNLMRVHPVQSECPHSSNEGEHSPERSSPRLVMYSQTDLSQQLVLEQPLTIDVDSGSKYFSGRCTLTLDKAHLFERVEESTLSKIVGFVWERKPQEIFPLAALLSVKADQELLRLVFANKSDTTCKTYRVKDNADCRRFVEELLRRCRLLRRKLTEWSE